MSVPSIAEFAQYRFVRDAGGNVVSLPAQGSDERILLVLDCERWGLARLHIFEGAALRAEKLAAFEDEMKIVSGFRSESVTRVVAWGRDGEELFYADEMGDGEPMPAYLGRAGKIPVAVASNWILRFLDLFESSDRLPPSMERLTTLNFEIVRDRHGNVRPVFSEFQGWTKPGAQVREHCLDWSLAQIFCSLIAGVPIRTFHRESLPRNFDELPASTREGILATLNEEGGKTASVFREIMQSGCEGIEEVSGEVPLPHMPLREWLRRELQEVPLPDREHLLPEEFAAGEEPYAIASRVRGVAASLQLLPALPRVGWLNQHHDATRRPGRGMIHQLQVNYLEDLATVTLVGEERVEGVDLATLVGRMGPLEFEDARVVGQRLNLALDSLEKQIGSCSVWWLPPENVFLLTGTRSVSGSAGLVERKGREAWGALPLKLRLHQTLGTLMDGVDLPLRVRDCSRLPGRPFEAARRSVVGVPLLWYLLTGTRFRWNTHAEHSRVSGSVAALFDTWRSRLHDEPEDVTDNFFQVFAKCLNEEARQEYVSEDEGGTIAPESGTETAEAIGEMLERTLYAGDLELPTVAEIDGGVDSIGSEGGEKKDLSPEEKTSLRLAEGHGTGHAFWLWIIVAGIVLAAVAGYGLSGWNLKRGLFYSPEEPEFVLPEFRFDGSDLKENAKTDLSEFLLSEGSPQSLRLLPVLDTLDIEAAEREIEPWLRNLSAKGEPGAARVMGLLVLSLGGATETASGWFLEGARKGDVEAQYHLAVLRWDPVAKVFTDAAAADFLEQAAESGHAPSRELFAHVRAAMSDNEGAFKWMELSADQGWTPAIYQLGIFHASGLGCEPDRKLAAAQFRKAAELGDGRAMFDYGRCLSEGYGVTASFPEALRWMRLATAKGYGPALRWLLDRGIDPNPAP